MQMTEISLDELESTERNFARKLQQQVTDWKTMRPQAVSRTDTGVRVERRFRRRPKGAIASA